MKGKSFVTLKAFSEKSRVNWFHMKSLFRNLLSFKIVLWDFAGASLTKIFPFNCNSDWLTCWFWVDFYTCTFSPKQPIIATVDPMVQLSCQTFVLVDRLSVSLTCAPLSFQVRRFLNAMVRSLDNMGARSCFPERRFLSCDTWNRQTSAGKKNPKMTTFSWYEVMKWHTRGWVWKGNGGDRSGQRKWSLTLFWVHKNSCRSPVSFLFLNLEYTSINYGWFSCVAEYNKAWETSL